MRPHPQGFLSTGLPGCPGNLSTGLPYCRNIHWVPIHWGTYPLGTYSLSYLSLGTYPPGYQFTEHLSTGLPICYVLLDYLFIVLLIHWFSSLFYWITIQWVTFSVSYLSTGLHTKHVFIDLFLHWVTYLMSCLPTGKPIY